MKHTAKPYAPVGNVAGIRRMASDDEKISGVLFRSYFALVKNDVDERIEDLKALEGLDSLETYFNDYKNEGYTNNFLANRLYNFGESEYKKGLNELFDIETNSIQKGVGFQGLIEDVANVAGIDIESEQFIENLNNGYNTIGLFFNWLGLKEEFGYNCIEDYLYDVSYKSLFTKMELNKRFYKNYKSGSITTVEEEDSNFELDSEVFEGSQTEGSNDDFLGEDELNMENPNNDYLVDVDYKEPNMSERPRKRNISGDDTSSTNINQGGYNKLHTNKKTQNTEKRYNEVLKVEDNPFEKYKGKSVSDKINMSKDITDIIMKDIQMLIGDYSFITKFGVKDTGVLVFNGTVYTPSFEDSFLETLPHVLKEKISNGDLVEFFNLKTVYKFKNLEEFIIEDKNLAQGRARMELALGFRKRYKQLFDKFSFLMYIRVGDVEYTRGNPDETGEEDYIMPRQGLFSGLRNLFRRKDKEVKPSKPINTETKGFLGSRKPKNIPKVSGWMGDVWESRPVKIATGALGWTLGSQAVYGIAALMGPWGLLFGGLAMAGAYKELKKPRQSTNVQEKEYREDKEDKETEKPKSRKK